MLASVQANHFATATKVLLRNLRSTILRSVPSCLLKRFQKHSLSSNLQRHVRVLFNARNVNPCIPRSQQKNLLCKTAKWIYVRDHCARIHLLHRRDLMLNATLVERRSPCATCFALKLSLASKSRRQARAAVASSSARARSSSCLSSAGIKDGGVSGSD